MWFFDRNNNKPMSFKKRLKLATNREWITGDLDLGDRIIEVEMTRDYYGYSESDNYKARIIENGWVLSAGSFGRLIKKIKNEYKRREELELEYNRKIN